MIATVLAALVPLSGAVNCSDVRDAHRTQSCCGNPGNPFTIPDSWYLFPPEGNLQSFGYTWLAEAGLQLSVPQFGVLQYVDDGKADTLYANAQLRFDAPLNLTESGFVIMDVYVESRTATSDQEVTVKIQEDGSNSSQTEIALTQPLTELSVWTTVAFDFGRYAEVFPNHGQRVVVQLDGENNTEAVTAYISNFRLVPSSTPPDVASPVD